MKQTILYLFLGIFLLASCQQEDLSNAETGYGYLAVSELSVATAQVHVVSSRADEEPLTIEILKDGETVKNLTETELANKIELEAGTGYSLKVYSSDYGKESEWTNEDKGTPVYYAEQEFEILTDRTTEVKVEVPMTNFGVSFQFPEEYKEVFPSCTLSVKVGERTVPLLSGETAYFTYAEGTTFSYTLTATNAEGENLNTEEKTYGSEAEQPIASGTIYTVSYEMETQSLSVAE